MLYRIGMCSITLYLWRVLIGFIDLMKHEDIRIRMNEFDIAIHRSNNIYYLFKYKIVLQTCNHLINYGVILKSISSA